MSKLHLAPPGVVNRDRAQSGAKSCGGSGGKTSQAQPSEGQPVQQLCSCGIIQRPWQLYRHLSRWGWKDKVVGVCKCSLEGILSVAVT